MAVTLETATRNAACNAIVDLIDAGTGNGRLELQTAGNVEVATFDMGATAYGAAASGTASLTATITDSSATGNASAVTQFKIYDEPAAGNLILTGSVSTSGADLNLTSTTIAATEQVDITQLDVTVPATP